MADQQPVHRCEAVDQLRGEIQGVGALAADLRPVERRREFDATPDDTDLVRVLALPDGLRGEGELSIVMAQPARLDRRRLVSQPAQERQEHDPHHRFPELGRGGRSAGDRLLVPELGAEEGLEIHEHRVLARRDDVL